MSLTALFGIAALAVFAVLVTVFVVTLVLVGPQRASDSTEDEETIDAELAAHGVRVV